jgi:hypothetical protein
VCQASGALRQTYTLLTLWPRFVKVLTPTIFSITLHGACGGRDKQAKQARAALRGQEDTQFRCQFPTSAPIDNIITAPQWFLVTLLYEESVNTDELYLFVLPHATKEPIWRLACADLPRHLSRRPAVQCTVYILPAAISRSFRFIERWLKTYPSSSCTHASSSAAPPEAHGKPCVG